jgi:hypothetical protein
MPRATDVTSALEPIIRPAPAHVPRQTPDCIGQSRRVSLPRPGPVIICHTFVIILGTTMRAAACAGDIARLSRPIPTVGRPRPVTPLTTPASRKGNGGDAKSDGFAGHVEYVVPFCQSAQCAIP